MRQVTLCCHLAHALLGRFIGIIEDERQFYAFERGFHSGIQGERERRPVVVIFTREHEFGRAGRTRDQLARDLPHFTKKGPMMKTYRVLVISVGLLSALAIHDAAVAAKAPVGRRVQAEEAPPRLREEAKLEGHRGIIVYLAFSSDGKRLISADVTDGTFRLWDMASGKNTDTFHHMPKDAPQNLTGIAVSPDGKTAASYDYIDKTIKLWDVSDRKHIATLKGGQYVQSVVFSADGKTLAATEDRQVRLWSVDKKEEIRVYKTKSTPYPVMVYSSAKRPLLAVEGPIRRLRPPYSFTLVDAITGEAVITCESRLRHAHWICALDRDETMVASAGRSRTIYLWDRKTGKNTATFESPSAAIYHLVFSPDGKILACGYGYDRVIDPSAKGRGFLIYEVSSGQVLADIQMSPDGARALAFSPDGNLLATGGNDGIIKLWTVPAAWRKKDK